jgi:hypothetical protein
MPNAIVRANARSMPRVKPGSAKSIARQTTDLKSAVALLKAAEVVEREHPERTAYFALEETIIALYYMTNMTRELVEQSGFGAKDIARMVDGSLQPAGLDGILMDAIYRAHGLAHNLFKIYHGKQEKLAP